MVIFCWDTSVLQGRNKFGYLTEHVLLLEPNIISSFVYFGTDVYKRQEHNGSEMYLG